MIKNFLVGLCEFTKGLLAYLGILALIYFVAWVMFHVINWFK